MTATLNPVDFDDAALSRAERIASTLYPHQVEGVAFLMGRRRSLLADDMGLGKTRQSIIAMTESEPSGPYLVVCPASVKLNWQREIESVLPTAQTTIVGPAPPPDADYDGWVVLNYDILSRNIAYLQGVPWAGLVFDEAHYMRNYKSQRSRQASALVRSRDDDPVVHALTGTPLTSRPRDLFPILQLINHPLGKSFRSFAKRYCDAYVGEYGLVATGASNIDELSVQLHGIMLRRTKDEVLDLPPKIRTWLDIELTQKRLVENLNKWLYDLLAASDRPDTEAMDEVQDTTEPEKRTNRGRLAGRITTARCAMASMKARHTIEFVEGAIDQGEKVIIFSCYLEAIAQMVTHFGDRAVALHGSVSPEDRQKRVDRFQNDDDIRVCIANIHVAGVGLNLTAARQVVFNDLDWLPANHWQAEDRAYRIGQTGAVNVTYMIARGSIDEFIRSVLESKASLIDELIEGKALAGGMKLDVIGELKRMMRALSISITDIDPRKNVDEMTDLIRQASQAYLEEEKIDSTETVERSIPYSDEAIQTLARVLSGPRNTQYRSLSTSKPGQFYTLEVSGADVSCDCPGFEYRGACRHSRNLKDALVAGGGLPDGFEIVE
jgi:SWI/SNF-related matrix-associated actin-dependent regulator of chromatin subfamily A-like protein 1